MLRLEHKELKRKGDAEKLFICTEDKIFCESRKIRIHSDNSLEKRYVEKMKEQFLKLKYHYEWRMLSKWEIHQARTMNWNSDT